MRVTVAGSVRHLCPYRSEVDEGAAELTFDVIDGDDAPELHDLAEQVTTYKNAERISHERFTRSLLYATGAVRAVTKWHTGGLDVTCDLSRQPNG